MWNSTATTAAVVGEEGFTESEVSSNVWQVLSQNWENVSLPLSEWQVEQLSKWDSELGITCLLRMWFLVQTQLTPGSYCNATWDGHYCWPPTTSGVKIVKTCNEAFSESQPAIANYLEGSAYRVCQPNATWLWGNWTNYSECADSYDAYVARSTEEAEEERQLVTQVQYILFVGSILSLACLLMAISIFCCFKSLWCDRVTIHIHLMAALTLRYALLYIITEPFVLNRATNYRDVDWICKTVLTVYLYATLTSVNWMFIQGVYLNGKLTTNVFDKAAPFKLYYTFGWITPVPLLLIYAVVMESNHPVKCWKGYSEMDEIWIILGPIIVALLINLLLLINILRILVTKVHRAGHHTSDAARCFRRAAKATLILSPILGINNLLFVYNPGGDYNKYYVILNSLFGSTQGVFVAFIYCYLSTEVHSAIRRCYRRFMARRTANRIMQRRRANSLSTSSGLIVEHPVNYFRNGSNNNNNNNNSGCYGGIGGGSGRSGGASSTSVGQSFSTTLQSPTGSGVHASTIISGTTVVNSSNSPSISRSVVGGGRGRASHVHRLCPISPFTAPRHSRNGVCQKHRHHAVFISRRPNVEIMNGHCGTPATMTTRENREDEENVGYNDVIIPLSELVQTC